VNKVTFFYLKYLELIDLNSSNSRNIDGPLNDQFMDPRIWNSCNNESQDSTQYYKKYESLKKKEKCTITPIKKEKKKNIQKIPNNNYFDYTMDIDEFSPSMNESVSACPSGSVSISMSNKNTIGTGITPKTVAVNKISSIQVKENNIDQLDKNSKKVISGAGGDVKSRPRGVHQNCVTEPDDYYFSSRPHFSDSFHENMMNPLPGVTPQKHYRHDNRSLTFINRPFINVSQNLNSNSNNSNINLNQNIHLNSHRGSVPNLNNQGFPMIVNKGSFISKSTQYSSNKMNQGTGTANTHEENNEHSVEYVEGYSGTEE
jgi:hypothetical protein